jgi:hypothetical protein
VTARTALAPCGLTQPLGRANSARPQVKSSPTLFHFFYFQSVFQLKFPYNSFKI